MKKLTTIFLLDHEFHLNQNLINLIKKMKLKRFFVTLTFISLFLMLLVGCHKDETITLSGSLDRMNWSERNYEVLNQMIKNYGIYGKDYNQDKAPYVILDWDQTCAYLDVEEATMHFQLFRLRFKMTKDVFASILKDEINGITQLPTEYSSIHLADINLDLKNDYNYLFDNYVGFNGTMTLEEIQLTPQYQDFISKIPFLYDGYCSTPGIGADYGYSWILYLFAGYTIDEVKLLAKEAISYELGNQLSKHTLQSPPNYETNAGVVSYSYKTGLRILPEMQDLIATFNENSIEVFIVSASYMPVVEVFSGIGNYGYNVPAQNVIAMELALDNNGKILPEYKKGWVKTQRQGKVDAINQVVKSGLGKNWDPLFSAIDSDGDYEMSTSFPDMKLTLIWNRVKGGDIGTLCHQAIDEMNNANPRYILQGRNENTGMVIPSSESILFGKTEPQLLFE